MGVIFMRETRRMQEAAHRRQELLRARRLGGLPARTHSPMLTEPCPWMCVTCGYLDIPEVAFDDPMRRDATVARLLPSYACPGCRTHAWVDLADVDAAQAIRDQEADVVAARRRSRLPAIGGLLATGLAGGLLLAGCEAVEQLVPVSSLMIGSAVHFVRTLAGRIGGDSRQPRRWHRPRLSWRAGRTIASGRLGGTATLCAPLSGRPAIAWVVTVRSHGDHGRSLALAEQACAAIEVDGTTVGRGLTIDVPPEPIANPTPEAVRWLLTRGLTTAETTAMYETVLCVGDEVEVRHDRKGGPPILLRR
jgi:hypothetical protein